MKKTFTLSLLVCLLSVSMFAQNFVEHTWTPTAVHNSTSFKTDATNADTIGLSHFNVGTSTYTFYTIPTPEWGFLHGTNSLGFKAFAEKYDIKGPDSSVQIIAIGAIFAGNVSRTGNPNSITFGVHPTSSGAPGAAVSTLQIYDSTLALVDTLLRITTRNMPTHAPLSDSFFVSFTSPTPNAPTKYDTLYNLVVTSRAAADTIVSRNVIQTATGAPFSDIYRLSGLRHYLSIFPVIAISKVSGVEEAMVSKNGLSAGGVFPNPVVDEANVQIHTISKGDVNLMIFDMNGELVSDLGKYACTEGMNKLSFDASTLSKGAYILLVQQEATLIGMQFIK